MPPIRAAKGAVSRFSVMALGVIEGRGGMKSGHIREGYSRTGLNDTIDDWLRSMKTGDELIIRIRKDRTYG